MKPMEIGTSAASVPSPRRREISNNNSAYNEIGSLSSSPVVAAAPPRQQRSTCFHIGVSLLWFACAAIPIFVHNSSPFQSSTSSSVVSEINDDDDKYLALGNDDQGKNMNSPTTTSDSIVVLPPELLEFGIYDAETDFENDIGKVPVYWKNENDNDKSSSISSLEKASYGPCYPEAEDSSEPAYVWKNDTSAAIPFRYRLDDKNRRDYHSIEGACRPGFLIIGAGKCGTSSLYHYLVGHPRVAPARQKQIHYFKYYADRPLGWYYGWFPTTNTFLQAGMLMTGEASPGYLPYPDVVHKIYQRMQPNPKVILAARNPLERMYSSYKYSYVQPTKEWLQKQHGNKKYAPNKEVDDGNQWDDFLFTFEDFVRAELDQLQDCFYGFGPNATRNLWYPEQWTQAAFDQRDHDKINRPPLIDLDEICYGKKVNKTVLRPQWATMQMEHPEKVIMSKNAFLIQALIGRSLYVVPLEWWYIAFPPEDILLVCTEELSDANMLTDLALNLGLPRHNFTTIVDEGAFNVGGHRGYDKATSWEEIREEEVEGDHGDDVEHIAASTARVEQSVIHHDEIPLPEELKQELLDFVRPFNDRLFALTGKECNWT